MKNVDLDVALRQRGQRVQRVLMAVLVGVLVLVTLSGVIVTVNPGVPATLGEMLYGTPTPTATLAPGSNLVYYENGAPWGKLTLDGHSIPIDATPKSGAISRGRHTLTYRADPFPPLRCTISTPAAASDTCPLDAAFASRYGRPLFGDAVRAVNLGSTLERLPAAQWDALIALVRSQVDYTSPVTIVRAGEYYVGVDGGKTALLGKATQPPPSQLRASLPDNNGTLAPLETATQPLNATIQIRLANTSNTNGNGSNPTLECALVCLSPLNKGDTGDPDMLTVWAHVKMGYHYTTQDGSVVLDYAPFRRVQQTFWRPDDNIQLSVRWNGNWQVTLPPQDNTALPCKYGQGDLFPNAGVYPYTLTGTRPAPNLTDGCLLDVHQLPPQPTSGETPYGPPILFLVRFGVLLAVGDAAHQLLPDLPVASQREADEANAIAAQGPLP